MRQKRASKNATAKYEVSEMADNANYRTVNKQLQGEVDYKLLGCHMQSIRQQRDMTQAAVAEKMKLGIKYYAAIEAGTARISLYRLIQFICIMQTSADLLLAGCHADYPPSNPYLDDVCKERLLLNKLLDQCPDETIKTLYVVAQGLRKL